MKGARIKRNQSGFTLIELVVVIVVLGILAATAIPRFVNMSNDARVAAVNGMAGALRSGASIVNARWLATGNNSSTEVFLQGQSVIGDGVKVVGGIPTGTEDGIGRALQTTEGFTGSYASGTATFSPGDTVKATCAAIYNGSTGEVSTNVSAC